MSKEYCKCLSKQTRKFIKKVGKFCYKCGQIFHITREEENITRSNNRSPDHSYQNIGQSLNNRTTSPIYDEIREEWNYHKLPPLSQTRDFPR